MYGILPNTLARMQLAVTIDVEARDHPCVPGNFRRIVDTLVDAAVPTTLFVQGGWLDQRATDDEIAALQAPGMVVGLHSQTHRRFTTLTPGEIATEFAESESALARRGIPPVHPLFRFPHFDGNTDATRLATVEALGWTHVDGHAIAYDWEDRLRERPEQVAQHAIDAIEARRVTGHDTAIVVIHSWPDPTPRAVRLLLDHAARNGDRFVALTEIPVEEWRAPGAAPIA
jgi:peptidoglycan/xylan/chitin deacetylase (PgdA/CDA1 family)